MPTLSRITWCNSVGGLPQVDNARSVPKRPVVWWGDVWLAMPDGTKDTRAWRAKQPITRGQAQEVLRAMLDDLIAENGNDTAIDSGFRMECR